MKNNHKKMTRAERAAMEAKVAALRLEAKKLNAALKADDEAAEDATEPLVEEVAAEVAEEVTEEVVPAEAPAEEESAEEAPVEAPAEEESVQEAPAKAKRSLTPFWLGAIAILLAAIVALMIAMMTGSNEEPPADNPDDNPPISGEVTEVFDMDAFTTSVANIAGTLTTDEDIATTVDVFVENIGATKLQELVAKHGELPVQKAIAEFLAFVPEIKMNQYINNNGLNFNPDAADDYYQMLDEANKAYIEATGNNPDGALMSLPGYETHKFNRAAMKALIEESGDTALLTWYEAKTNGYDAMVQQNADTEKALAYKEEVKLEIVTNTNGSVKLLEAQLDQKVVGTNPDTLRYAEAYYEFIINNYMYVVAN